jgi:hypothetical protein
MSEKNREIATLIQTHLVNENIPLFEWDQIFQLAISNQSQYISPEGVANRLLMALLQSSRDQQTSPSIKTRLPNLTPVVSWPIGDYGDTAEGQGKIPGGIIAYLTRVWLPILEAGRRDGLVYVQQLNIDQHYPGVTIAVKKYQEKDIKTGIRKFIPENLRFPVEYSFNNPDLKVREELHLLQLPRKRMKTARKKPGIDG